MISVNYWGFTIACTIQVTTRLDTTGSPVLGELSVLQKPNCGVCERCWPSPGTWESPPKKVRNITGLTDRNCGWRSGLHHGIPSLCEEQRSNEDWRQEGGKECVFLTQRGCRGPGGWADPPCSLQCPLLCTGRRWLHWELPRTGGATGWQNPSDTECSWKQLFFLYFHLRFSEQHCMQSDQSDLGVALPWEYLV